MSTRKRRPKPRRAETVSTVKRTIRLTLEEDRELQRRRRRRQLRTLSELVRQELFK